LALKIEVYDINGKTMSFDGLTYKSIVSFDTPGNFELDNNNGKTLYTLKVPANYCGILQFTVAGFGIPEGESGKKRYIDLSVYYSVPRAKETSYLLSHGATSVIYNSLGADPVYH